MANTNSRKEKGLFLYITVLYLCVFLKYIFLHYRGESSSLQLYATCFVFLFLFGVIFFYAVYKTVSRTVSYRKMRDQYRNAAAMLNSAFLMALFIGGALCVAAIALSKRITENLFQMNSYGEATFTILSASLPFFLLCAVMIGWFAGFRILSRIYPMLLIFSISDLLFSLIFMLLASKNGASHAGLVHDPNVICAFTSLGGAMGFSLSVFFTFVWLFAMTLHYERKLSNHIEVDYSRLEESTAQQLVAALYGFLTPFCEGFTMLGFLIFNTWLFFARTTEPEPYRIYGSYLQNTFLWYLLFLIPSIVLGKKAEGPLRQLNKNGDRMQCGSRMLYTLKQFLTVVFPGITVTLVLAPLLDTALFGSEAPAFSLRLLHALFSVFFFIQILLVSMCKACDKNSVQILFGLAGFVLQSVVSLLILHKTATITNYVLCNLISVLLTGILYVIVLNRKFTYRKRLFRHLFLPFMAALAAFVTALLCTFLRGILGNILTVLLAAFASFAVHSLAIVGANCISKHELREIPLKQLYLAIGIRIGVYKR